MNDKNILERQELLKKLGFGEPPNSDPTSFFTTYHIAYDSNMVVRGDHDDDWVYIYYSCEEYEGELLDGFFHAPSILEHPLLNYQIFDINAMLDEINQHANTMARLVFIGVPMIFVEISEYEWKTKNLHIPFSDMLKLVGILDYYLSRELNKRLELQCNQKV